MPVVAERDAAREEALLIAEIRRDEGEVLHAYQDSLGYWTIGVGRLIDNRRGGGVTADESAYLLKNDIARSKADLDRLYPWWRKLAAVRRRALINMTFQLGAGTMQSGAPTMRLIQSGDYDAAADRLKGWLWASQTPNRADRIIAMIRTGQA